MTIKILLSEPMGVGSGVDGGYVDSMDTQMYGCSYGDRCICNSWPPVGDFSNEKYPTASYYWGY